MPIRRRTVIYDDRPKFQVVPDGEIFGDTKMEKIDWLWENRIPLGQITMIMSDPGLGKSTLSLMIAAHVTQGRPWPDDLDVRCPQGMVLTVSSEDDPNSVMKPRLVAAGADVWKVILLKGLKTITEGGKETKIPFDLKMQGVPTFEYMKKKYPDLLLIVIDPVAAYMGDINSHNNTEVRAVLDPIAEWAAQRGVAILMIHHLNKNDKMRAAYRGMGSLAFTAVARMVWGLTKSKDDLDLRLMTLVKGNVAPKVSTLGFRLQSVKVGDELIDTAVVAWEDGTFDITADEALGPEVEESLQSTNRKATAWLKDVLKEGSVLASDIYRMMEEEDVCGERTLKRVKKQLGVRAERRGEHWYWKLF